MRVRHVCADVVLGLLLLSLQAHAALGFASPAALNSNAGSDSGSDDNPVIQMDSDGHCVAVWYSDEDLGGMNGDDRDILVATSPDYGQTWTTVKSLNSNSTTDSGSDQFPDLALGKFGNWVAVWGTSDPGAPYGSDSEIFVSRSTDNGATWSAVKTLNNDSTTDTASDFNPSIATDMKGNWIAVWNARNGVGGTLGSDYDMLFARSTDNGETWTTPAALNGNAASDTGDDFFGTIETDGAGVWVAAWDSTENLGGTLGTDRDILFTRSTNNGMTWSTPAALNSNAAFDSKDDDGIGLASDKAGHWIASWITTNAFNGDLGNDNDILYARSTNGAAWTAIEALNTNAETDTGDDYTGGITPDGFGNWVAVWSSTDNLGGTIGTDSDVLFAKSTNNGKTWTAPTALVSTAASDSGGDAVTSAAATDGLGHWICAWQSNDTLGNTVGSDYDIFFTTSTSASGDHLKLLAPNGGEKWKVGKKQEITWASVGDPGANVQLELLRNGSLVRAIQNSTANDGVQKWKLPTDINPGKGYSVRIISTADTDILDVSDDEFRVKAAK